MSGESVSRQSHLRSPLPPLKALNAFEVAARLGSFALAAEELGVTPSAISHQIQSLESFLGVKLFERRGGRVTLTGTGNGYRQQIETAFRLIADATEVLAPSSQGNALTIISAPTFAMKWLRPRLPLFLAANPDVRVRLSTLAGGTDLGHVRFDIAITYGRPIAADVAIKPLVVEQLNPLCSPTLASALALRTPRDLSRATLIHSANLVSWSDFFHRIGIAGVRPQNELWLDRSIMAIEAATEGLGVILESNILTETERAEGRLVAPFTDSVACVEAVFHFLVTTNGFRSSRHGRKFFDWLVGAISGGQGASGTEAPPQSIGGKRGA